MPLTSVVIDNRSTWSRQTTWFVAVGVCAGVAYLRARQRKKRTSCTVTVEVPWVANKRFEISKFKFEFPRARNYEIIGLVLGCVEAKFCK